MVTLSYSVALLPVPFLLRDSLLWGRIRCHLGHPLRPWFVRCWLVHPWRLIGITFVHRDLRLPIVLRDRSIPFGTWKEFRCCRRYDVAIIGARELSLSVVEDITCCCSASYFFHLPLEIAYGDLIIFIRSGWCFLLFRERFRHGCYTGVVADVGVSNLSVTLHPWKYYWDADDMMLVPAQCSVLLSFGWIASTSHSLRHRDCILLTVDLCRGFRRRCYYYNILQRLQDANCDTVASSLAASLPTPSVGPCFTS